jgi:transposase
MHDILAIDMGKNKSVFCRYASADGKHQFGSLCTSPKDFEALLKRHPGCCVVIEISPHAGWVSDLCNKLGLELKVVNTTGEEWKWNKVKDKSDRADSLKIAKMQAMGLHRYVHLPAPPVRRWRELIAYRDSLRKRSTASKNRIRSILDRQGDRWPAGKKGWTVAAMEELAKLATPLDECGDEQLWRGMLHEELACLKHTLERMAEVEQKLDALSAANPRVQRLKTTPGVGNRTAEIVIAMLDEPTRFTNVAQVGSYTGLTPRRLQSGQMDRQVGISHAGSKLLRTMLVQSSWIGQRYNPWMKETFERICGGKKDRKKKAIVAVARQLFVRLWAMDRSGTDWKDPTQSSSVPSASSVALT